MKTSRRDLALVMARGLDGATTVSATMLLAARAGIQVFVTGGADFFSMLAHWLPYLSASMGPAAVGMLLLASSKSIE